MKVNVLDRKGLWMETLDYSSVPAGIMFPDEKLVKINWDDGQPITPDDLRKPIRFMGTDYVPYFGAGSDAKQKITWGMKHDLLEGTAKFTEDVTRFGRWAMAQGWYGLYSGKFTMTSRERGFPIAGASVQDGCGYIRRSLAEKVLRKRGRIKFRTPRVGWMFWQRLDWNIIGGLCEPLIEDMCSVASDPTQIMYTSPKGFEYKSKLFEIDRNMVEHPYIARTVARTTQDRYARLAHSVHIPGETKLIVPSNAQLCWPGHSGKLVAVRSPIDSNSSMQALEIEPDPAEEARIASLEAMQVSISKIGFFSKGLLIIAEDNELPADVVLCEDDVKMGPQPDGTIDAAITVIQAWEPGQCVGVGSHWNGRYVGDVTGGDWDGDTFELHDCNDVYEPIWQAILELPEASTPKLKKTKHPLKDGDLRPEMLSLVMYNLVGFATNLHARTFAMANREWIAYALGFESVQEMDAEFNRAIKLGTDIQKSYIDPSDTIRFLNVTQANLNRMGLRAPWTGWDAQDWTQDGVPVVVSRYEEGFDDTTFYAVIDDVEQEITRERATFSINEQDGTCAQIARIALPILAHTFNDTIPVRPLIAFRDYVERPNPKVLAVAEEIQRWWNARITRVNYTDDDSARHLRLGLEAYVEKLNYPNEEELAEALWFVAHSARDTSMGSSVFDAFPEQCLRIVAQAKNAPTKSTVYTALVGVEYQVPGGLNGEYEVEAVEVTYKGVVRMALCGSVSGQRSPSDASLPSNMLGLIAKSEQQPHEGKYKARIVQSSGSTWDATLVGI